MASHKKKLKALEKSLSQAKSKDEKLTKIHEYFQENLAADPLTLTGLAPSGNVPSVDHMNNVAESFELMTILDRHDLQSNFMEMLQSGPLVPADNDPRHPPPFESLPCANQDPNVLKRCDKNGTKRCSACMLVAYCSAACQKSHWPVHKRDCKDTIRSVDWKPNWVREGRIPTFVTSNPITGWDTQSSYGMGYILWGNMPAIDIINVATNEGTDDARNRDFSLAFAASGDLRNVIRTVNELPGDYQGHLSICLNDHTAITTLRNIVILSVLGLMDNVAEAAEYALHIWYSVFLPLSYIAKVLPRIVEAFQKILSPESTVPLGPDSTLKVILSQLSLQMFAATTSTPSLSPGEANNALSTVMLAPERLDYRHRYFASLEPSHRLALLEWRRFGLVLPFGAPNAHLNIPNRWLFSPDGRLYLYDSANPLDGWDIDAVIASGSRHGATREDIIGCLFFHIKDQLIEFTNRIRRFKIDISIFDLDASELATKIKDKSLSMGPFDRIEVSNIVDNEYVGLKEVLADWGPLLNPLNPHSALIGLFMNWVAIQEGARAQEVSKSRLGKLIQEVRKSNPNIRLDMSRTDPMLFTMLSLLDGVYDNSEAFSRYLKGVKAPAAAKSAGLKMRRVNTIVPQRPGVSLGRPANALPEYDTKEKFYNNMTLGGVTTTERYIEWVMA